MASLTPYPISEQKSGTNNYLEPWIRPSDAFEPLNNAYIYRGVINKRAGYSVFGDRLDDHNPVMGIMQYINESTGDISLIVASTTNLYKYNTGTQQFDVITAIAKSNFWRGRINTVVVVNTPTFWPNMNPGSINITAFDEDGNSIGTMVDDGVGGWTTLMGVFVGGAGTINYSTGAFTFTFNVAITDFPNAYLDVTSAVLDTTPALLPIFTGNNTNFFHWINWQPTDPQTSVESTSFLYMTNNVDPITLYDGTSMSRPVFYTNTVFTNYIKKALDVNVFENRLLIFKPTLNSPGTQPNNQAIYFSKEFNPTDFATDLPGHGGVEVAATGDIFIAEELLRNTIVCFFSNSTWLFRFTGIPSAPFRFDRVSVNKRNNCPYGTMGYDERATSIGSTGFLACDGVNVQRYDTQIIDYYETQIAEAYYNQCFSQRYDNLSQTWILYVTNSGDRTANPIVGSGAPGSDRALVYNHLENTWSTFIWTTPMSCMGQYFLQTGRTWASFNTAPGDLWENTKMPWNSYSSQKTAPILLMGDQAGNIYRVDDVDKETDNGVNFGVECAGTRWNPLVSQGQKYQLPYIDIYYQRVSSGDDPLDPLPLDPVILQLQFYVDNSNNTDIILPCTLDGTGDNQFYWKRIYCNLIAQFVQMVITGGEGSGFKIVGITLWAAPAGRLTP